MSGYGAQIPVIYLTIQPGDKFKVHPRPKTALQLLHGLGLAEETALVIRDGRLLTPDRQINPGDFLIVRAVGSRG